jgi:hypothetical protein
MLSGGDFGKRTVRAVPYVGIQASAGESFAGVLFE